jgi:hypothetical protein
MERRGDSTEGQDAGFSTPAKWLSFDRFAARTARTSFWKGVRGMEHWT